EPDRLRALASLAHTRGLACYTAYSGRFEPHLVGLKRVIEEGTLGLVHLARMFLATGAAIEGQGVPWGDRRLGIVPVVAPELVDTALFPFGLPEAPFELWSLDRFEHRACDHALFGSRGLPSLVMEVSHLSWRNGLSIDVYGDSGSAHLNGLCKWGP